MSEIIRFTLPAIGRTAVGVRDDDRIYPVAATMSELLRVPLAEIRQRCEQPAAEPVALESVAALPPLDGRGEVWAAGVTYQSSRLARMEESAASADVYARVYDAARPELFYKSAAWRVAGHGDPVTVRADSQIDVPEPELALVLNSEAEIVGYTICNDVSSRDIEGENPLYLPQAKAYHGGCALGPVIRPAWEIPDPYSLGIGMTITRDGKWAWSGRTSTSLLHRRFEELVGYLFRDNAFPDGVALSTGTSLVPDLGFTLQDDDRVDIVIDQVGMLSNPVVRGSQNLALRAVSEPAKV
jgi:2-dehydro-3-deoxy-D-arabinonate dehydratase